ncbi:hypothetical protein [Lactococcus lactis]|uniref:hypothetical protein n=2 Tax=Lactococcus lactis TaxID=1358 RepID=UPI0038782F79
MRLLSKMPQILYKKKASSFLRYVRAFIANIETTGKCPLSFEVENQNYTKEKSEDQEEYWNGIDRELIKQADEIYRTEGLDIYSVIKILITKTVQENSIPIRFNKKTNENQVSQ